MKSYKITLLPGDGIGPEITNVTHQSLTRLKNLALNSNLKKCLLVDQLGIPSDRTLQECKDSDAVLLAAIGDPSMTNCQEKKT